MKRDVPTSQTDMRQAILTRSHFDYENQYPWYLPNRVFHFKVRIILWNHIMWQVGAFWKVQEMREICVHCRRSLRWSCQVNLQTREEGFSNAPVYQWMWRVARVLCETQSSTDNHISLRVPEHIWLSCVIPWLKFPPLSSSFSLFLCGPLCATSPGRHDGFSNRATGSGSGVRTFHFTFIWDVVTPLKRSDLHCFLGKHFMEENMTICDLQKELMKETSMLSQCQFHRGFIC